MFADYKSQVLNTYHKMRAENQLSTNLAHPTPAKLRTECLEALKRYTKKDEQVLRSFFGAQSDLTAYAQVIRKFEIDKFRPLKGVMLGNIMETDTKNIELLAWLIDFKLRPYVFDQAIDYTQLDDPATQTAPMNTIHPVLDEPMLTKEPVIDAEFKPVRSLITPHHMADAAVNGGKQQKALRMGIVVLASVVLSYGVIMLTKKEEKCMYWTGDHYESISCNEKKEDTPLYALDSVKIVHFKRIMRPDTITPKAIGSIWYFKADNKLEYYTSPGSHPVYTERRLKPLTSYMLERYPPKN